MPSGTQTIQVGQAATFTGTGTDPDGHTPLTHRRTFGAGSGIANSTKEDPGSVTFPTAGVFTVTYTATDALGLADPTPTTIQVTMNPGSTPPAPAPPSLSISNLSVASGQTSYVVPPTSGLQAGGTVYRDRSFTCTTVPPTIQGAAYIQTANDEKYATTSAFLNFTVSKHVKVYVAHDVRITMKPSWLSTFTDTGTNLVTSDTTLQLFVRSFPAGTITLAGNAGTTNSMYSVIVKPEGGSGDDTTAPTISLTAPSVDTVSGTVTVSASASDNVGVTGVQFRLQGANLGPKDTSSPYSTNWNTTTVAIGFYALTAIAREAAGNTKTSAPITITVNNTGTPSPPSSANIQVNFQPAAALPAGYQKDDGSVYTSSGGYGWANGGGTMRERNTNSDQRLDTFIQLKPDEANTWRYDRPNEDYTISLVSSDPDYALSPQRITVEGKVVIDNLRTSTPNTFLTITDVLITIADSTLTITLGPQKQQ